MKFIATRIETLIVVMFLWVCEGIFWSPLPYFTQKPTPTDATDPIGTVVHAVFLGLLVIVAVVRHEDMRQAMRCSWPIMLLVVMAFLSAFWSDEPDLVLRRSLTLTVTTVLAAYIAVRFETPRLIAILVKLAAIGMVASFIVMVADPKLATGASMDYPNAVRGAFSAKNTLGGAAAIGIIVSFYALLRGYGSRLIAAAVTPAALVLLYVSQSATAVALPAAAAYAAMVAAAFRRRDGIGLLSGFTLVVVGLAGVVVLALGWDEILPALNRNPTLTGRVEIWQMAITDIGHRPMLGFGFGAFWGHNTIEAWQMWQKLYWIVPHAHNAWLEIGLSLGIVGMVGITIVWLIAIYRGLNILSSPPATHAVFWIAMLPAILLENMTEYEFFKADSIFWVLFSIGFVYLGREALARKAIEQPVGTEMADAVPVGVIPASALSRLAPSVALPR